MTTVSAPFAFVASGSDLITDMGLAKVVMADMAIERAVAKWNVLNDGVVAPWGDLAGRQSNVLAVPNYTGLGYAASMAAASSESASTSLSSATTAQDSVTVARQELAFGETWTARILGGQTALSMERVVITFVDATLKRILSLACTNGASISTAIGATGRDTNYDDVIALSVAFREAAGFDLGLGMPKVTIHPEQLTGIQAAMRSEAGLQFPDVHESRLAVKNNAGFAGTMLGMDWYQSNSVTASSGVWQGFAGQTGFIGLGVGSASGLNLPSGAGAIEVLNVPELGLSVWMQVNPASTTVNLYAYALLGTALASSTVRPQFRLIGIND
jgi:hypothetical protein